MGKALIIESSNFLWLIVGAFAFYRILVWRFSNKLSHHNIDIIQAWLWIFGAAAINHGWFALSRHLSPDDARWNAAMFEWRFAVVVATSAAFSWGMLSFIRLIDGHSYGKQITTFILSFIAAYALGYW